MVSGTDENGSKNTISPIWPNAVQFSCDDMPLWIFKRYFYYKRIYVHGRNGHVHGPSHRSKQQWLTNKEIESCAQTLIFILRCSLPIFQETSRQVQDGKDNLSSLHIRPR